MIDKAVTAIGANLKDQPLVFGLLVMNILFLVFMIWVLNRVADENKLERAERAAIYAQLQAMCTNR